ncbi:MAG: hypothetical protein K8T26_06095 [Lentisphaerae bacterium]|nr:hypothetical protein [Lentisphaerota bacterium]
MDPFEQFLSQQPLRGAPEEWRRAILDAAERAAEQPLAFWRRAFWPSPVAWAALAALWLIIGGVNFGVLPPGAPGSALVAPDAAAVASAWNAKRLLIQELAECPSWPAVPPPLPLPPCPQSSFARNRMEEHYA